MRIGVSPAGTEGRAERTTRARRTPPLGALWPLRASRLAQYRRPPGVKPLPLQYAGAFWPLARHSATRVAHVDSVSVMHATLGTQRPQDHEGVGAADTQVAKIRAYLDALGK
jgi:hypothetical protein